MKDNIKVRDLTEKEQKELIAAIQNEDDLKAKSLIEQMNDVNNVISYDTNFDTNEVNGSTALSLSSEYGRTELINHLIRLGADVNLCDTYECSVLMKATYNEFFEIVKILIENGADVNHNYGGGFSALSEAVSGLHNDIFEYLVSLEIDLNKCGGMALIDASMKSDGNMIKRLIDLGVDVNFIDSSDGFTSLHHACKNNYLEVVELLMENGADENVKNIYEQTPIDLTESEKIKEFINNYNSSKFILK